MEQLEPGALGAVRHHRQLLPGAGGQRGAAAGVPRRRLRGALRVGERQHGPAAVLQDLRLLGRHGRLPAVLGAGAGRLLRPGGLRLPAHQPGAGALRDRDAERDPRLPADPAGDLVQPAGDAVAGAAGGAGAQPAAAAPGDGDAPADALPGLHRLFHPLRPAAGPSVRGTR